jgi:hypothetical protein
LTNSFHFFSKKKKIIIIIIIMYFFREKKFESFFFEKNCPLKMGSTNFTPPKNLAHMYGRRRTYLIILKRTWSANYKMVWYILLRPLRPELDGRPSFSWNNLRKHHQNQHNCRPLVGTSFTEI